MALRLVQFPAMMLTALALVPSGAHLAALPNRWRWRRQPISSTSRPMLDGPLRHCPVRRFDSEYGAAIVLRKLGRSFRYALASFCLLLPTLPSSLRLDLPDNQATNNWTVVPKNWNAVRIQWEYSHAANAVVRFAALVCVVMAVLRQPSQAR
jgi:hypothetical protein